MNKNYPALNINVLKTKKRVVISTEEALKKVTPIEWGKDVESNNVKIYITAAEEENRCVK